VSLSLQHIQKAVGEGIYPHFRDSVPAKLKEQEARIFSHHHQDPVHILSL
jgi:hypothetical protein